MRARAHTKSTIFRNLSGGILCALGIASGHSALAWGIAGHRLSANLSIDCLPTQLRPLYSANRAWIVRHSTDPDDWRRDNFALESPRHFIDIDAIGTSNAASYPMDFWVAVGMYGKGELIRHGTVPWRIAEFYGKLINAFRSKNGRAIIEDSAWLGHYVSDCHVPFHATTDYDGQSTGQKGIHARFETALVEQTIKPSDLVAHDATFIDDPVKAAFRWARGSLALCPGILAADKRAILKDADYGFNYYVEFASTARPIAIRRLEESAQDSASLWTSAWIAAGRPPLPPPEDVHVGDALNEPARDPDIVPPRQSDTAAKPQ